MPYRVNFFNEISCISISLGFCSVFKELILSLVYQRQKLLYHIQQFCATVFLKVFGFLLKCFVFSLSDKQKYITLIISAQAFFSSLKGNVFVSLLATRNNIPRTTIPRNCFLRNNFLSALIIYHNFFWITTNILIKIR